MNKVIEYETIVKVMQEMELGHTITLVSPSGVRTFSLTSIEPLGKNIMGCGSKPPFTSYDELVSVDSKAVWDEIRNLVEKKLDDGEKWVMHSTKLDYPSVFQDILDKAQSDGDA